MAWVTVEDIATYCPDSSEEDIQLALDAADGLIKSVLIENDIDYSDPQEPLLTNLKTVTKLSSIRALQGMGGPLFGITDWSQTAGPVSQSVSNKNGIGSVYLTGNEYAMLGCSKQGRATQVFYSSDVLGGGEDA